MPLAIYHRHSGDCQFYGRPRRDSRSQKCSCPIWVQGSLGGENLRRSLDLVSWQAAQDRVRGWEASGEIGVVLTEIPAIIDAVERVFDDAKSRGLSEETIGNKISCYQSGSCRGAKRADFIHSNGSASTR